MCYVRIVFIFEVFKVFVVMILFIYMIFLRGGWWIVVIELELFLFNKRYIGC